MKVPDPVTEGSRHGPGPGEPIPSTPLVAMARPRPGGPGGDPVRRAGRPGRDARRLTCQDAAGSPRVAAPSCVRPRSLSARPIAHKTAVRAQRRRAKLHRGARQPVDDAGPVAWPPPPIRTERLVLREPEARDRAAFIELLASSEVHTYLGEYIGGEAYGEGRSQPRCAVQRRSTTSAESPPRPTDVPVAGRDIAGLRLSERTLCLQVSVFSVTTTTSDLQHLPAR